MSKVEARMRYLLENHYDADLANAVTEVFAEEKIYLQQGLVTLGVMIGHGIAKAVEEADKERVAEAIAELILNVAIGAITMEVTGDGQH